MPAAARDTAPVAVSARAVLAANMIRRRRDLGWSQEALAFECGLHRTFVAHVERQVRNVSIDNVERIAQALGVAVYELLMPWAGQARPGDLRRCRSRLQSLEPGLGGLLCAVQGLRVLGLHHGGQQCLAGEDRQQQIVAGRTASATACSGWPTS